jgi:hypothetical protein
MSLHKLVPPVVLFREPGAVTAALLDGLHRYRVSLSLGFASIPGDSTESGGCGACLLLSATVTVALDGGPRTLDPSV